MIDETDWAILRSLQENARLPFAEVGRQVGLSAPAVAERVRKLEESGIISGYHAAINTNEVGLPIIVFIQLGLVQGRSREVVSVVREFPEILECHNVTGQDCFIMKAAVPNMQALQILIEKMSQHGRTVTSVVLAAPIPRRMIDQPAINQHLYEQTKKREA
ncbi:MAG: Lrp/AsnC family transcriptional regulator [Anaerolineae bacterium]|nr:Lrp/AsnC family transcriptional regulator [Anaerolineae bacterium]